MTFALGLSPAHAGEPAAAPFELKWEAPEECPNASAVRARVDRLLHGPLPAAGADGIEARAVVTRHEPGWRVTLETQAGNAHRRRVLEADSCEGAADATALIVALMIDPEAALPEPPPERPSKKEGPPPARPTAAAEERQPHPPRPMQAKTATRWLVRLGASLEIGALPEPSSSLEASVGLKSALRLELAGSYSVSSPVAYASGQSGAGGEFSLATAGVRGCYAPGARLSFGPCVGLEIGALRGASFGVDRKSAGTSTWSAVSAGPLLAWNVSSSLSLPLRVEGVVPFSRPRFTIDHVSENLFRSAPICGRVTLGLELGF